ncbi:hypothetical protein ACB092_12G169600 [Castanea dentata]
MISKSQNSTRLSRPYGDSGSAGSSDKTNIGNGVVMYENAGSEARVLKFLYSGFFQVNLYDTFSVLI